MNESEGVDMMMKPTSITVFGVRVVPYALQLKLLILYAWPLDPKGVISGHEVPSSGGKW